MLRVWRKGNPLPLLMGMQTDTATMENSMEFFKKLAMKLSYPPTIPLVGIYPEKSIIERDTCTPIFVATLFTIARTWKHPRCPLTDEWIQKLWYINKYFLKDLF